MKLPKSISPCPIRESVAGIRFESNVPADAIFGIVYQTLQKEFGEVTRLPILDLPAEIRNTDKELLFQPYYRLENQTSAVLIGPKMIAVGLRGAYPGWQVHSERIKNVFQKVHETGVCSRVNRMGIRYINFFQFDIFLNLALKITAEDKSLGPRLLYCPIISLSKLESLLLKTNLQAGFDLQGYLTVIRSQQNSSMFYLPKNDILGEEAIALLDRINNCDAQTLIIQDVLKGRLFTLSDYGFYLFLFKLSLHLTRIREGVARN